MSTAKRLDRAPRMQIGNMPKLPNRAGYIKRPYKFQFSGCGFRFWIFFFVQQRNESIAGNKEDAKNRRSCLGARAIPRQRHSQRVIVHCFLAACSGDRVAFQLANGPSHSRRCLWRFASTFQTFNRMHIHIHMSCRKRPRRTLSTRLNKPSAPQFTPNAYAWQLANPPTFGVQITIFPEDFKLLLDLRRFGSKELWVRTI